MKSKKLLIVLIVLISLIVPITLSSLSYADLHPANDEIEWGVKEGKTYTWVVKQSSFGFLPENSEIKITITSIRMLDGGNATELIANITRYNSLTQLTTTLLNNDTFISFDSKTNTTTLYNFVDDHGLFFPLNYRDGFTDGLMDFYISFFDVRGYGTMMGYFHFYGYRESTNLVYIWNFNKDGISDDFVAVDIDDDPNDQDAWKYWLVLKTSSSKAISSGSFFWIFIGLTMISLIYISKKRFMKNL
ncbi:MAG: hypothetical protein ACFFAI_08855 [Promethearchaeota archaeon]